MDAQSLIARRIAKELRDGMLVNLGIGIPTLVANFVPPGIHVFFQSENGLIGTGPVPISPFSDWKKTWMPAGTKLATWVGMPMPRLTSIPGLSSRAMRRAISVAGSIFSMAITRARRGSRPAARA